MARRGPPGDDDTQLTITDLAREFDITPRAIRFYEDHGILAPTREGPRGLRRVYSPRDRTRLKLDAARQAARPDAAADPRAHRHVRVSQGRDSAQARRFLAVLGQHRSSLEQQREDIEVTLTEIARHEAECRRILGRKA